VILLGKRKLREIQEKYGNNNTNLNPHSDQGMLAQKKSENKEMLMRIARTRVYHRFKRIYKSYIKEQRKHIVLKIFGYWKYWVLEGKIGPDETEKDITSPYGEDVRLG
jgi:hypothetical protein